MITLDAVALEKSIKEAARTSRTLSGFLAHAVRCHLGLAQ